MYFAYGANEPFDVAARPNAERAAATSPERYAASPTTRGASPVASVAGRLRDRVPTRA
jgi:hypothetical protein